MKKENKYCYACTCPATTREHVPPKSFFPEGYRENLITVPSCEKHNHMNSQDVEYVCGILMAHVETSEEALKLLSDKVWRSYDRSPALLRKTFQDAKHAYYRGQKSATFTLDILRYNKVMSAMASGLYFHTYAKRFYGSWDIYSPSTFQTEEIDSGRPGPFQAVRDIVSRIKINPIPTTHPNIFAYGDSWEGKNRMAFKFQFYKGMETYAVAVPFWSKQDRE